MQVLNQGAADTIPLIFLVCSVVSNSLQPARLLCPWDSPGKNTEVGCHALLQGIFPSQGWNLGLPHCRQMLYCLNHQGSPWEVVKCTLLISTVQNGNLSFLDCFLDWGLCLRLRAKTRVSFCMGVVVKRMLLPSLNSKCFRWGRLRSNHKREKYIILVSS